MWFESSTRKYKIEHRIAQHDPAGKLGLNPAELGLEVGEGFQRKKRIHPFFPLKCLSHIMCCNRTMNRCLSLRTLRARVSESERARGRSKSRKAWLSMFVRFCLCGSVANSFSSAIQHRLMFLSAIVYLPSAFLIFYVDKTQWENKIIRISRE